MAVAASVEEYLSGFTAEQRAVLDGLRAAIRRGAPGAAEAIRYQMAAFHLGGHTWLHLGGWAKHAGLYPVPRYDDLEELVGPYRTTGSTLNLRYADPVPYDLVERLAARIAAGGETG